MAGKKLPSAAQKQPDAAHAGQAALDAPPPAERASSSGGPACEDDTLLDEAMTGRGQKRRKLSRQTTDQQVDKAIKDNFKDWTATEVDMNKFHGQTLRKVLFTR